MKGKRGLDLFWRPVVGLCVIVLFAVGSLQNTQSFSIDAGAYMEIGSQIMEGAVPYRDLWDHKPPAIYAVNSFALWLFPPSPGAISLFETLWNLLGGAAFFNLARKLVGERWAWAGVMGLAIFLPLRLLSAGGNTPELYLSLPVIVAYLGLVAVIQKHPEEGGGIREFIWLAVSGMALMLAGLFKPPELAHLVVVSGIYGYRCYRFRSNDRLKIALPGLLGLTSGAMLVLGLAITYLLRNQALSEFWWQAIVYNSYYVQSRSILASLSHLRSFLDLVWPHLLILFVLGSVPAALMFIKRTERRVEMAILYAWLSVELVSFVLGQRFFVYHFIPTMPVLVLLSTIALQQIWQAFREPEQRGFPLRTLRLYVFISLLGLGALPFITQVGGIARTTRLLNSGMLFAPVSADPAKMSLVQVIRNDTRPGDPVFIWGADAGIYFLSDRPPASRFIYIFPLLNSFGGLWEGYPAFPHYFNVDPLVADLMTDLDERPPAMILVEPRFFAYLDRVPEFKTHLAENYFLAKTINDWKIYAKNHE